MNTSNDFTVVLLCRDRPKFALRAWESIISQETPPGRIVISDNSVVYSDIYLNLKGSSFDYIYQGGKLSARDHMSLVGKLVSTKYFMMLHDDDQLGSGYISRILDYFNVYPDAAALAPRSIQVDESGSVDLSFPSSRAQEKTRVFDCVDDLILGYCSSIGTGVPAFSSYSYRRDFFLATKMPVSNTEFYDAIFLSDLLAYGQIIYVHDVLFKVTNHGNRISSKTKVKDYKIFYNWAKLSISNPYSEQALNSYRIANLWGIMKKKPLSLKKQKIIFFKFLSEMFLSQEFRFRVLRKLRTKAITIRVKAMN